jgi:hypothetical protein
MLLFSVASAPHIHAVGADGDLQQECAMCVASNHTPLAHSQTLLFAAFFLTVFCLLFPQEQVFSLFHTSPASPRAPPVSS